MGRPLAILSEGRLSESQIRALTLLSLGWLELIYVPEDDGIRDLPIVGGGDAAKNYSNWRKKLIKEEDEIIFSIISTFIKWQELKVA